MSFLNKIQSIVDEAQNAEDLASIITYIPLQSLKNFINATLQSMHTDKIRTIYYTSSSIQDIIANDVIQSMLTYVPSNNCINLVNKCFNKLVKQNDDSKMRLREINISSQFRNKNTWIVDSSRNSLNTEEIKKGIKGPINSIDEALNIMESGDKIILSQGKHTMEKDFIFYEKNIQIEGVGNGSVLNTDHIVNHGNGLSTECCFHVKQNLSLSNILVDANFESVKQCKMWVTNCTMSPLSYIMIENAELDCMRCEFLGDGDENVSAIQVVEPATLCVTECVFNHRGGDDCDPVICVCVIDTFRNQCNEKTKLKIIGNKFQNSYTPFGCPLSQRIIVNKNVIFKNNTINDHVDDVLYYFCTR